MWKASVLQPNLVFPVVYEECAILVRPGELKEEGGCVNARHVLSVAQPGVDFG